MKLKEYIFKSVAVLLFVSAGLTYVVMSEDDDSAIIFDIKSGSESNLPEYSANGKVQTERNSNENALSDQNGIEREAVEQNDIDRENDELNGSDRDNEVLSKNEDNTDDSDSLIDINSADKSMLTSLPGIGPSKADAIIAFRNDNGKFDSIEELMLVPGIKEGTFNKLNDLIKAE